jgi:hypothetical protein
MIIYNIAKYVPILKEKQINRYSNDDNHFIVAG